jgi:DNA-binding response OmpR family regulator
MDGWETLNKIKALAFMKETPIIFLTSSADKADKERAFSMGIADYITKPFDPAKLISRIESALRR